jgi:hypothetical protein
LHGIQGICGREGLACEVLGLKSLHHGWLYAEAVPLDLGPFVGLCLTLLNASEIKCTLKTQALQLSQIVSL